MELAVEVGETDSHSVGCGFLHCSGNGSFLEAAQSNPLRHVNPPDPSYRVNHRADSAGGCGESDTFAKIERMAPRKQQDGAGQAGKKSARPGTHTGTREVPKHVNFPRGEFESVDPIWLLKAGGITLATAALLAYASVCVYIYVGAWRNLLRPVATISVRPAEPYTPVQFDAAETGKPRLTGWWIPARTSDPGNFTLLFLHGGDGSLSTSAPELDQLHEAGVNIFAVDYRGYGQSDEPHPTEKRMLEDSSAALDYLTNTRHLAPRTIVPYGTGLGAVLAADLVKHHAELPAVVIANPWPDAAEHVIADPSYRLLPIGLLQGDQFDLEDALKGLDKPKLLISGGPGAADSRHPLGPEKDDNSATIPRLNTYFAKIADPKMIVSLTPSPATFQAGGSAPTVAGGDVTRLAPSLERFLEQYLHRPKPRTPVDEPGTVHANKPVH
jgi:pimeloyl-ACP methyl ester carboxylesterase